MFNDASQIYWSWSMNLQEFSSWVADKVNALGQEEFNKMFPTFEDTYDFYCNMLK